MAGEKALIHAVEVRGEESGLVAARSGADFYDRVAIVERIAGNEERLEVLLELGDARLEVRLFGACLLGQLGVVNENELANLRELVFEFVESAGQLDDR